LQFFLTVPIQARDPLDAIFAENLIVQGDMNIIVLTSVYYLLNRLYVLDDPIRSAYVLHYKSRHETKENEIVKGPVEEYKFFFLAFLNLVNENSILFLFLLVVIAIV
jgi:hypothetical protein